MTPVRTDPASEPPTLLCEGVKPIAGSARLDPTTHVAEQDVQAHLRDVARSDRDPDGEAGGPEPGSVIGGIYRVIRPLGSGAMGVVLLAHDESLDRKVAIKLIQPNLMRSDMRDRFADEARAMARVSHANVLQIHSLGEHEGAPYFVMEFVEGQTLEQWLRSRSETEAAVDVDLALSILEGTCRGVMAIHAADTIHRDLKPSNILLDARLRPRVADLGVAIICRSDRPSKPEIVGTALYMAPEIAFQREVPPSHRQRADVYSLGCLAYELLTGKPPFEGEGDIQTMLAHANEELVPPSRLRPDLPEEFDEVLARALSKDPSRRTPTVEALLRELVAARIGDREPIRILIAEDHDDFREALEMTLAFEFPGAEIESCRDGEAALQAFDRSRPSAVILDLRMPGIDGMLLTQLLRSRDPERTIPILILTASGGPSEWSRLSALGADGFLVKPIVSADVLSMLRRSLQSRTRARTPSERAQPHDPPHRPLSAERSLADFPRVAGMAK
jgi:serine/threonine-protein kinase